MDNGKWRKITEQDYKRYQWLRHNFSCSDLHMDNTYRPRFTGSLPRARSLDEAIDQRIREIEEYNRMLLDEILEGD